jgi:hypothetical protein
MNEIKNAIELKQVENEIVEEIENNEDMKKCCSLIIILKSLYNRFKNYF